MVFVTPSRPVRRPPVWNSSKCRDRHAGELAALDVLFRALSSISRLASSALSRIATIHPVT